LGLPLLLYAFHVFHLAEGNKGRKDWDRQAIFFSFGSLEKPCSGVCMAKKGALILSGAKRVEESPVTRPRVTPPDPSTPLGMT
jgi:hypothetical protein